MVGVSPTCSIPCARPPTPWSWSVWTGSGVTRPNSLLRSSASGDSVREEDLTTIAGAVCLLAAP